MAKPLIDRGATPSAAAENAVEKAARVIMLRATWETQEKLREWAKAAGFDLGWSYSGWPQASWDFDFHVTLVASSNAVQIENGCRYVDPITLTPTGYAVLGQDRRVPVISLEGNKTLSAMREFFIASYGVKPTFEDFKPHISLSYKWNGEPPVGEYAPALPDFPLVFDVLMVATLDPPTTKNDAAPMARKATSMSDRATVSGTRRTKDGYLVADVKVARGGNIQDYYGWEIGEGEPNQLFKVYRPEDEIFRADSLSTFAHKPVTFGHPEVGVTPDTWRRDAVGHVGSEVVRDGEFVRVPLVVMDGGAISEVESGTREISMGYECDLVMTAGVTADGRAYDAYQKNIRINHCAIVAAGRAGPSCRIGDSARINNPRGATMKTVTIDGKTYEVADDVAASLAKGTISDTLTKSAKALDDATTLIGDLKKQAEDAKTAADEAKAKADAAEKKVPTADELHKLAADLAVVLDAAKMIAPDLETKGKMVDQIKREAVAAKLGDDAIKDKSADYIAATFDMIAKKAVDADPVADAIASGAAMNDAANKPRQAYLDTMSNAWKH